MRSGTEPICTTANCSRTAKWRFDMQTQSPEKNGEEMSCEERQRHGTDQQGTAIAGRKRGDGMPIRAKAQHSSGLRSIASELNCIDRRRKERKEQSVEPH